MITLPKLTALVALVFMGLIAYYLWYPFEPLILHKYPIPVISSDIKAGGQAILHFDIDKRSDCTPEVKWYLVDGFILPLNDTGSIKRPMGDTEFNRAIPIPTSAPTNVEVHLRLEYSCRVNPLRTISYSWDSETFYIQEAK